MDNISSQVETDTAAPLIEEDSLVEEISIDGMCGVY
ncbi:mycofactocin precursor [Frondihabitans sp. PAMC 28766]|nr:mycofactocin precursor MftA [Frondihabitans sp. PAMC 28766]AMM19029.1 mycofactocin precursor [Frondihabitans sp. PAMC 28766]